MDESEGRKRIVLTRLPRTTYVWYWCEDEAAFERLKQAPVISPENCQKNPTQGCVLLGEPERLTEGKKPSPLELSEEEERMLTNGSWIARGIFNQEDGWLWRGTLVDFDDGSKEFWIKAHLRKPDRDFIRAQTGKDVTFTVDHNSEEKLKSNILYLNELKKVENMELVVDDSLSFLTYGNVGKEFKIQDIHIYGVEATFEKKGKRWETRVGKDWVQQKVEAEVDVFCPLSFDLRVRNDSRRKLPKEFSFTILIQDDHPFYDDPSRRRADRVIHVAASNHGMSLSPDKIELKNEHLIEHDIYVKYLPDKVIFKGLDIHRREEGGEDIVRPRLPRNTLTVVLGRDWLLAEEAIQAPLEAADGIKTESVAAPIVASSAKKKTIGFAVTGDAFEHPVKVKRALSTDKRWREAPIDDINDQHYTIKQPRGKNASNPFVFAIEVETEEKGKAIEVAKPQFNEAEENIEVTKKSPWVTYIAFKELYFAKLPDNSTISFHVSAVDPPTSEPVSVIVDPGNLAMNDERLVNTKVVHMHSKKGGDELEELRATLAETITEGTLLLGTQLIIFVEVNEALDTTINVGEFELIKAGDDNTNTQDWLRYVHIIQKGKNDIIISPKPKEYNPNVTIDIEADCELDNDMTIELQSKKGANDFESKSFLPRGRKQLRVEHAIDTSVSLPFLEVKCILPNETENYCIFEEVTLNDVPLSYENGAYTHKARIGRGVKEIEPPYRVKIKLKGEERPTPEPIKITFDNANISDVKIQPAEYILEYRGENNKAQKQTIAFDAEPLSFSAIVRSKIEISIPTSDEEYIIEEEDIEGLAEGDSFQKWKHKSAYDISSKVKKGGNNIVIKPRKIEKNFTIHCHTGMHPLPEHLMIKIASNDKKGGYKWFEGPLKEKEIKCAYVVEATLKQLYVCVDIYFSAEPTHCYKLTKATLGTRELGLRVPELYKFRASINEKMGDASDLSNLHLHFEKIDKPRAVECEFIMQGPYAEKAVEEGHLELPVKPGSLESERLPLVLGSQKIETWVGQEVLISVNRGPSFDLTEKDVVTNQEIRVHDLNTAYHIDYKVQPEKNVVTITPSEPGVRIRVPLYLGKTLQENIHVRIGRHGQDDSTPSLNELYNESMKLPITGKPITIIFESTTLDLSKLDITINDELITQSNDYTKLISDEVRRIDIMVKGEEVFLEGAKPEQPPQIKRPAPRRPGPTAPAPPGFRRLQLESLDHAQKLSVYRVNLRFVSVDEPPLEKFEGRFTCENSTLLINPYTGEDTHTLTEFDGVFEIALEEAPYVIKNVTAEDMHTTEHTDKTAKVTFAESEEKQVNVTVSLAKEGSTTDLLAPTPPAELQEKAEHLRKHFCHWWDTHYGKYQHEFEKVYKDILVVETDHRLQYKQGIKWKKEEDLDHLLKDDRLIKHYEQLKNFLDALNKKREELKDHIVKISSATVPIPFKEEHAEEAQHLEIGEFYTEPANSGILVIFATNISGTIAQIDTYVRFLENLGREIMNQGSRDKVIEGIDFVWKNFYRVVHFMAFFEAILKEVQDALKKG